MAVHPIRELCNKRLYEEWDVFAALTKGWDKNRKDIQSEIKITAKFFSRHHFAQVAVCGRHKPNVYPLRLQSTEPVIAGSIEAMKKVLLLAKARGAQKAEILDVPVPSHCPLLQPVADLLTVRLKSIELRDPKAIYIANATARAIGTAEGIRTDLANSIAHGVRWFDSTVAAQELGCTLFLEAPPGHVLTSLVHEILADTKAYAITENNLNYLVELSARSLKT